VTTPFAQRAHSGNGSGDMTLLVPDAGGPRRRDYVYLYAKSASANGGFESGRSRVAATALETSALPQPGSVSGYVRVEHK